MNDAKFLESEIRRIIKVWDALAPPLRPSIYDIELYDRGLKDKKNSRILVQGATPELIDLALRKNASRIIAMSWETAYLPAMRHFGSLDWTRVEAFINDWRLFIPELKESLDVVLGDGTLTLLTFPQEWELVLQHLHQYLVPGGHVILRLSFQPEEPFDLDLYMKETLSRLDAECSGAESEQRLELLRNVVSEIRIAFGVGAAETMGFVDLDRRADWVRFFHAEFTARFGKCREWDIVRIGMPKEEAVRNGKEAGKAVPRWDEAAELIEECGFRVRDVKLSGTRPAPGVMRLFSADRI